MHYQRRLIYGVCLPLLSDNQTDTALVIHPAFPLACASGFHLRNIMAFPPNNIRAIPLPATRFLCDPR